MAKVKKVAPSLNPQTVNEGAWYYESRRGIELITQKRTPEGEFVSGDVTRIPWSKLLKSARRCGVIDTITPAEARHWTDPKRHRYSVSCALCASVRRKLRRIARTAGTGEER